VACCSDALKTEELMERRTLEQLEAALDAVRKDLAPRVEELAEKSTNGVLTPEEHREYAEAVRLNDMLSILKLQAEELWSMRAAS
jgi:glutamine synthetase type III